jgi:hypothetical protein
LDDVRERLREPGEDEGLDCCDVARQARQQVTEPAAPEEIEREGMEMAEHPESERADEALADPGREIVVGVRHDAATQRQRNVGARDPDERPEVAWDEHVVDQQLEHPNLGCLEARDKQDENQIGGEPAPERPRVRPERSEDPLQRDDRRLVDEVARARPDKGATAPQGPTGPWHTRSPP